jgi:hypothetical protein
MSLLEQFNQVDIHGKMNLVNDYGEFILTRFDYYKQNINLYSLPGFHVEIYYSPSENKIVKIESVNDNRSLDKYLPYIELKIF